MKKSPKVSRNNLMKINCKSHNFIKKMLLFLNDSKKLNQTLNYNFISEKVLSSLKILLCCHISIYILLCLKYSVINHKNKNVSYFNLNKAKKVTISECFLSNYLNLMNNLQTFIYIYLCVCRNEFSLKIWTD